jgi:hypothetical protein
MIDGVGCDMIFSGGKHRKARNWLARRARP